MRFLTLTNRTLLPPCRLSLRTSAHHCAPLRTIPLPNFIIRENLPLLMPLPARFASDKQMAKFIFWKRRRVCGTI
jgi:hypothetical protein